MILFTISIYKIENKLRQNVNFGWLKYTSVLLGSNLLYSIINKKIYKWNWLFAGTIYNVEKGQIQTTEL